MGSKYLGAGRALLAFGTAALVGMPLAASADASALDELEARVSALEARLANRQAPRIGTAAVPADIVGTWSLRGFQTELHAGPNWQVRSYVFNGKVNFKADGSYTLTSVESGNELVNGGATVNAFVGPEEKGKGRWVLKGTEVILDGSQRLMLDAGATVMTYASPNPDDPNRTTVMLVVTKYAQQY